LHWEAKRILTSWSYRWSCEIFHEFGKQSVGFEAAQVRKEVLLGMLAFAQQSFVAGKNLLEVLDLLMPVWCGLCYFVVVSLLFVGYDLQSRI
jgi:hypothetical protein